MSRRIPVVVVAGFLGSGKTTLLNHLLRNNAGTRIGVVVNDFGAIAVDSMLVAGQVDSMVSLGNGCLCCAVDASELDDMLARLARPRSPVDVIVVEASGLAEPRNLVRMVVGSENPRIGYGGLVEVVDAAEFTETRRRHPEILGHLRLADLVVLNKADRVDAEQLALLTKEITATVGQVPVYPTAHSRIDPALLFDPPARPRVAEQLSLDMLLGDTSDAEPVHLHVGYQSLSFRSDDPLDPRGLLAVLEDPPPGLFRMKGFARFAVSGRPRKFLLHMVGRHLIIEPGPKAGPTELVFLGPGLDTEALAARLQTAVHSGPLLPESAMLGVHRYVPGGAA